jgi:hypothetical protein
MLGAGSHLTCPMIVDALVDVTLEDDGQPVPSDHGIAGGVQPGE